MQPTKIKQLPKKIILAISVISLLKFLGIPGDVVLAQSRSECEEYARNYANRNSRDYTLRGVAEGAATGALLGMIFDDPGAGAGVGAIVGGLEGSSRESSDYRSLFNLAYNDCIRGRVNPRDYWRY